MKDFQSSKDKCLMEQIATVHHPIFRKHTKKEKLQAILNFSIYRTERLVEQAISARAKQLGHNINFIDGYGMDYDDQSDCKTCTLAPTDNGQGYISYKGSIKNIFSKGGDIRLVVYCVYTSQLMFYFIPYYMLKRPSFVWSGESDRLGRISLTYNTKNDTISKIERFRVASFDDLCLAESTVDHVIEKTLTGDLPTADVLAA